MTTPQSNERDKLAVAIGNCNSAKMDLASVQATLEKACTLQRSLQAQLNEYRGLDEEIQQARANKVRECLERGGDESNLIAEMPGGFASRLVARDKLVADIEAITASIVTFTNEVTAARAHLDACLKQVEWAAEEVQCQELD